jgi:hypothetical protein
MARYYFHLCDGADVLLDSDGRELDDDSVAEAALAEARAIIAADVLDGHVHLDQQIEVRDSQGKIVHSLAFENAIIVTHLAARGS